MIVIRSVCSNLGQVVFLHLFFQKICRFLLIRFICFKVTACFFGAYKQTQHNLGFSDATLQTVAQVFKLDPFPEEMTLQRIDNKKITLQL